MTAVVCKRTTRDLCVVCQQGMEEAIELVKLLPYGTVVNLCEGHTLFLEDYAKWEAARR